MSSLTAGGVRSSVKRGPVTSQRRGAWRQTGSAMTLYGSVLGYDSASAPLEPEGDAQISYLPFPSFTTEFLQFHHLRSSSRFLLLSVPLFLSLSLSLYHTFIRFYRLGRSRSASFPFLFVFPRFFLLLFSLSFSGEKFFHLHCLHESCASSLSISYSFLCAVSLADFFCYFVPFVLVFLMTRCLFTFIRS